MSSIQATSCNSLTLCEPWFKLQSLFYGQRQQQYAAIISILLELLVALSSSSLRNKNGTWCPWVPFESFFTSSTFRVHVVVGQPGVPTQVGAIPFHACSLAFCRSKSWTRTSLFCRSWPLMKAETAVSFLDGNDMWVNIDVMDIYLSPDWDGRSTSNWGSW